MTITETLPSWFLGKYPKERVIEISYNEDFAQQFGRRNKEKVKEFGKKIFGIELSSNTASATEWELSNNIGGMKSRGVTSGVTGNPCRLMIIDDPVKNRQEADSETFRQRLKDEWRDSYKTRLAAGAKVIIINTRWHEDDLTGYILDTEDNVEYINLPCEAEENDVLGRKIGEPLAPEIGKGVEWLRQFKKSYQTAEGSRSWLALFQGRPTAVEGNIIKRHWFRYWKPKGVTLPDITIKLDNGNIMQIEAIEIPMLERELQSWDLAFKGEKDNDKVAGGVFGSHGSRVFLKDCVNKNLTFTETIVSIIDMTQKHPESFLKLIEDKANGPAVIDMLQHKIGGIVAVKPEGSKQARMSAVSPILEAGNYYVPHPSLFPWVNEYIEQMCSFPTGKNDDLVDMTSQGLYRFIYSSNDSLPSTSIDSYDEDDDRDCCSGGYFD
jgi:predicted phage terminase large subunit-like protein